MSTSAKRFEGITVLVIGGAHGIERACANRSAVEGARLAIADLDLPSAERVVGSLNQVAGGHVTVVMDVTQTVSVDQAVASSASTLGGMDVVVNVEGGDTDHGAFEEIDDWIWLSMLELNLLSVARCCRADIPHLRRSSNHPAIVNEDS